MDVKIAGIIRAQVVLQGASSLPEDRFVNTYHFDTREELAAPVITQAHWDGVADMLRNLYNMEHPVHLLSIGSLISNLVLRSTATHIRMYHLGDDMPRPPKIVNLGLDPAGGLPKLPAELAVCGSYFADRNVEGRRGRNYFGPLEQVALSADVAGADRQVHTVTRDIIAAGLRRLADQNLGGARWVLLSKGRRELVETPKGMRREGPLLPPEAHNVTGGWVDNAFDVQRRRGVDATTRTLW